MLTHTEKLGFHRIYRGQSLRFRLFRTHLDPI
jgi:hypothetical protein